MITGEDFTSDLENRMFDWKEARNPGNQVNEQIRRHCGWINLLDLDDHQRKIVQLNDAGVAKEVGPLMVTIAAFAGTNPGGLVIIDPLNTALGGAEETNVNYRFLADRLWDIVHRYPSVTILVAQHVAKNFMGAHAKGIGSYASRGGTVLIDSCRWSATLTTERGSAKLRKFEEVNGLPDESLKSVVNIETDKANSVPLWNQYAWIEDGMFSCLSEPGKKAEHDYEGGILDAMNQLGAANLTVQEIKKESLYSESKVRAILRKLEEEGRITSSRTKGAKKIYSLIEEEGPPIPF